MRHIAPAGLREAIRRDCFIEGLGSRQYFVYRAYHRPTGIQAEFIYPQGARPPAFASIVEGLLNKVLLKLFEGQEEQIYAPVA